MQKIIPFKPNNYLSSNQTLLIYMFPFFSFGYLYYMVPILQIICILHALKTNRRDWIYILIFLPGIGGIIYIIREILHHSIEGRYHYGLLLKEAGRKEEARNEFNTVLEERTLHPKHVRRINARWFSASRKALAALKKA